MLRAILLLCSILAICGHQATAVWPLSSGERSSSSNVDYTNSINSAISSFPSYINLVTSQHQQTQPQLLNAEGEVVASGQLGTTTEVKPVGVVSHGVKGGVTHYPTRIKGSVQQPAQQLQDYFSPQTEIFNHGYIDPQVDSASSPTQITGTVNYSDGKEKEGGFFRYIFPWRWGIGRNGSGEAFAGEGSSVQKPSTPKRSWLRFWPKPSRTTVEQQVAPYCYCFQPPTVYQPHPYPSDQQQPQQQQPQHQQPQQHYSTAESPDGLANVRPVEPSLDFVGEGSNSVPSVVPAPTQMVNVQQQQQSQQQQQQPQVANGATADSLANHRQQQQLQQQTQQYVQQFQSVPVVTNFHQSAPTSQQQPAESGSHQQSNSGQVVSAN